MRHNRCRISRNPGLYYSTLCNTHSTTVTTTTFRFVLILSSSPLLTNYSTLCNTHSTTVTTTTFRFVLILSSSPLLTNPSVPLTFFSPLTKRRIWSGTHGAWRKNEGLEVTLAVRFDQRISRQGLYSLVILFVCVT